MLWIIFVAGGVFIFLLQSVELLVDVFQFPTTLDITEEEFDQDFFPVVTICNANKLRMDQLDSLDSENQLRKLTSFQSYTSRSVNLIRKELESYLEKDEELATENDLDGSCIEENRTKVIDFVKQELDAVDTDSYNIATYFNGQLTSYSEGQYNYVFQCNDKSCFKHFEACKRNNFGTGSLRSQCDGGEDISYNRCGFCPPTQFQCETGSCVEPMRRCDGIIDCPDGSDEDSEFCDLKETENYFVCCSSNLRIPIERRCDAVIDCTRDYSDEILFGCLKNMTMPQSDENNTFMTCVDGSTPRSTFTKRQKISLVEVGDGVTNCDWQMDEVCAWKKLQRSTYSNPFDPTISQVFAEYDTFLKVHQEKPASLRWYGMGSFDEVEKLGHQQQDLFIQCSFNNEDCENVSNILQSTTQEFGNCFHVLTYKPVNRISKQYGLSVLLNAETYRAVGSLSEGSGVSVFLTPHSQFDPKTKVFSQESRAFVPTGFESDLAINKEKIEQLPDPFSECGMYGKLADVNSHLKSFTYQWECESDCLNREKLRVCKCLDDLNYANNHDASLCEVTDVNSVSCVNHVDSEFVFAESCECPDQCEYEQYSYEFTLNNNPTNDSMAAHIVSTFRPDTSNETKDFLADLTEVFSSLDLETGRALRRAKNTFLTLKVYLTTLTQTTFTYRALYTMEIIFSNLGGLVGLYLGLSVLSLLEVVDLFMDGYKLMRTKIEIGKYRRCRKKLKNRNALIKQTRSLSKQRLAQSGQNKEKKLDKIEERSEREETMSVEHNQSEFRSSVTPKNGIAEIDQLIREFEETAL